MLFDQPLAIAAVPLVLGIFSVMGVAYFALGLLAGSMIMAYRTAGPFLSIVTVGSGLFGGVYFASTSLPSWLSQVPAFFPLTYGLRASRKLLAGQGFSVVQDDLLVLAGMTVLLVAFASATFVIALRYARRAGTLSQY